MAEENAAKLAKAESALREAILATSPSTTNADGPSPTGAIQGALSDLLSAEHSDSMCAQDTTTVVPVGGNARADAQVTLETASLATSLTDQRILGALKDYCEMLARALEEAEATLGRIASNKVSEILLERLCVFH